MQRRASYGPTSPVVGARGAATRRRIAEVALELFASQGYHATVMEDIARSIGTSRATLYQYFAGKEEIFIELIEESGTALQQVARSIEPLGPTAEGFANLRRWLDSWSDVFDRYEAVFVEWANVNSPATPLRPRMNRFVTAHVRRLTKVFADGGCTCDPQVGAIVLSGVIERYHYIRAVHDLDIDNELAALDLAVACQLMLFPGTPRDVFGAHGLQPAPPAPRPTPRPAPRADRFESQSPQAQATVANLLDAASTVFARYGHAGANVDHIVGLAGVSRGTAYKYFDGAMDIFGALADECREHMGHLGSDLATTDPHDSDAIKRWLASFLSAHHRYAGVLRAWTMNATGDARVDDARDDVLAAVFGGFASLGEATETPIRPSPESARLMFVAMLERSPDVAVGTSFEPTDAELVAAQAQFVERGLLGGITDEGAG